MTVQTATTIITPAAETKLVSRDAVKAELGIAGTASDALIDGWIDRASAAIVQFCNRPIFVETVKDRIWPERDPYAWQVPGGVAPLQLSRWPIVSLADGAVVVATDVLVLEQDFTMDAPKGQLIRLDPAGFPRGWGSFPVDVTYSAGYATSPLDIQDACIRLVKGRWYARKRDPLLKREDIPGVISNEYWIDTSPSANGAMPPDVVDLLDNYRVPVTG